MGRTSRRMPGWRELVFPPLPYIVVYLAAEDAIEISERSFLKIDCLVTPVQPSNFTLNLIAAWIFLANVIRQW